MTTLTQASNKMAAATDLRARLTEQAQLDRQTLAGPEVNIRLSLSPRAIVLLASPASVLLTMLVGWFLVKTFALDLHAPEMIAAAVVATLGGLFAALPLVVWMKRGAIAIAQCGLMGIFIRVATILGGLGLVMYGPGWHFERMPLAYWTIAFYFPLLIAETATIAWLSQRAKY